MEFYKVINDTFAISAGTIGKIIITGNENKTGLTMFYPLDNCPVYRSVIEIFNLERIE